MTFFDKQMYKIGIAILLFISFGVFSQNEKPVEYSCDTLGGNGRAMPSAFQSPALPMSDWSGGPVIGEAPSDPPDYLMSAIEKSCKKPWTKWDKTGIKILGWIEPSYNFSSSKQTNSPMCYDIIPNRLELDQVVLRFERDPN